VEIVQVDWKAVETAIVSAVSSGSAMYVLRMAIEQRRRESLGIPTFAYSRSFELKSPLSNPAPVPEVKVEKQQPPTRAPLTPAGHRQFLPSKTSEELQAEFKKREEDKALPRASRWTRARPDRRAAVLYVGTLAIAFFTLLLVTGRLPFH